MKKNYYCNTKVVYLIRMWLVGVLIYVPFQYKIYMEVAFFSNDIHNFLRKIDEITIIALLPLALLELYKKRDDSLKLYVFLLISLLLFMISVTFSGSINNNPLSITMFGIVYYIKYFFVIFIYAAFFRNFRDFKVIFKILIILTAVTGLIGLVQEFWALFSRYIMDKDITDEGIYLLHKKFYHIQYMFGENGYIKEIKLPPVPYNFTELWRLSLFRASSFLGHYKTFGIYSLLIISVYLFMKRKINIVVFILLFCGVFVSVSRTIYTGFVLVGSLQILKGRYWLMGIIFPMIVMLAMMVSSGHDINIDETHKLFSKPDSETLLVDNRRAQAIKVGKIVFLDYPFFGVGPGTFTRKISDKYESEIYQKYKKKYPLLRKYSMKILGADVFWLKVLVETGIFGLVALLGTLTLLTVTLLYIRRYSSLNEEKGALAGLAVIPLIIIIYGIGSNINDIALMYTYCALAGLGLGCSVDS